MADVTYEELLEASTLIVAVHGAYEFTAYIKSVYNADLLSDVKRSDWNALYLRCKNWPSAALQITFQQLVAMQAKIWNAGKGNDLKCILMERFGAHDVVVVPHTKLVELYKIMYEMSYGIDNPAAPAIVATPKPLFVNKHRYNMRLQGWELLRTIDTTDFEWAQAAVKNSVVNEIYRYTAEQDGKSLVLDSINGSLFD